MSSRLNLVKWIVTLSLLVITNITYAHAQKEVISFATTTQNNTHWAKTLMLLQEKTAKYTDGQVEIKLSFGGAMGNDTQLLQKSQLGSQLQGAVSSGANLGSVVKVIRTFDVPFIIEDTKQGMDLFYKDGQFGGAVVDEIQKSMHKKNLHLLYVVPFEFRGILTSKKEIRTPNDMKGLKIRVTPSAVERDMISNLGSGATTMGISEVYTALQTGTIDGLAIPPITSVAFALDEVGKQFNMLNFQPHGSFYVLNYKFWQKLSQKNRDALQRAANESVMETLPLFDQALDSALEKMKKNGVNLYIPRSEEKKLFKQLIVDSATKIAIKGFNADEMKLYEILKSQSK